MRPLLSGSRVTARDSFLPQTEDDEDRALHGALRYGGAVDIAARPIDQAGARHHPMRLERCLQHQHRDRQLRGFQVSVKALVCGDGFSQGRCVAKWRNEWNFFMFAGSGMNPAMLPAPCSALPAGLAMVAYYPDTQSCCPAADLAGITIAYTRNSTGTTPRSITLYFAEHDD